MRLRRSEVHHWTLIRPSGVSGIVKEVNAPYKSSELLKETEDAGFYMAASKTLHGGQISSRTLVTA